MKKLLKLLYILFLFLIGVVIFVNMTIIIKSKLYPDKIPDFMGYKPFVVLSGSMETQISVGDLVIVKETDCKDIKKDDIIAFRLDKIVITHRIVSVDLENETFNTKGDNNNARDDFVVNAGDVEGKFVCKLPGMGHVVMFLSQPLGMLVVMFGVIIVAGMIYISFFRYTEEERLLMQEFEEFKKQKEKMKK